MILGLAAPTSGRALVFDHSYAELPRAALRIGAVLEATDFHPSRSGRAVALLGDPELLILDEPANGLDRKPRWRAACGGI